jgi:hypothetical protein
MSQIFQDSDIDSIRKTELRNWRLYTERKNRKQKCKWEGCITRIGYLQDEYCRVHEQPANDREIDSKLFKGKK